MTDSPILSDKGLIVCDGCGKSERIYWKEIGPWTRRHALECPKRKKARS